jgi:hypothetical protein
VPVFVVTHNVSDGWSREDAPVTLVTVGVESAVAQATVVAGDGGIGDGGIGIGAADIVRQCLNASPWTRSSSTWPCSSAGASEPRLVVNRGEG